jgi:clan AA aspartic protease
VGVIYARLSLTNEARADLRAIEIDALVDSGAYSMCIPEIVREELQLKTKEVRKVELADGSVREVDFVSPLGVRFDNRFTVALAAVLGNEVLLGAIPMQDLDVIIDPRSEEMRVPPERPNFALVKVK